MGVLLLHGDTERSPALRHELPIGIIDSLLFAEVDGRRYVLTTRLEADRVQQVLPDAEVLDYFELGYKELVAEGLSAAQANLEIEARAVEQIGLREATVPGNFPLALADRLREQGVALTVDDDAVALRRRAKNAAELEGIRAAQRAAEAGMEAARELLSRAEPAEAGLRLDGRPILAEDVRAALREACAQSGAPCPPDVIVSSAWQGGGGHEPGYGPLPAGLPIHVDLWPRHEESACWADMARTFLVGEPVPEHAQRIAEMDELARRALEQAKASVRPGVKGRELFDATCEVFEAAGYGTQRTSGPDEDEGFQFSLGHGVGLEVHEAPSLGLAGRDPLVVGDVLALEPGLVDGRIGAIVSEDLVLVTEDGCEVLTRFPYELSL